jgi:hypothetical protein
MENQDAYHNQCNVNTAYEPGLNEQDDREGERGEQLLSLIGQDSLPPEALRNLRSAKTSVTTISELSGQRNPVLQYGGEDLAGEVEHRRRRAPHLSGVVRSGGGVMTCRYSPRSEAVSLAGLRIRYCLQGP